MQQLPKEFVGRMVRTVLFIGLVAACCAGVLHLECLWHPNLI